MVLELAEQYQDQELFMFVPAQYSPTGQDTYINEAVLYDLPDDEFDRVINVLEHYQQQDLGLFCIGKKCKEKKAERKARKQEFKLKKKKLRSDGWKNIGGTISGLISGIMPGDEILPEGSGTGGQLPPPEKTFLQKYGLLAIILGGIGTIYFVTKKK